MHVQQLEHYFKVFWSDAEAQGAEIFTTKWSGAKHYGENFSFDLFYAEIAAFGFDYGLSRDFD